MKCAQKLTVISEDKYIVKNNTCYPKCDVANDYLYIDTDTYVCLKACPSNTVNENYVCKEFVDECTLGMNKMGDNIIINKHSQFSIFRSFIFL